MDQDAASGVVLVVSLVVSFLVMGIPIMQIAHKAGYSRAWVLMMFVPLANIIMLWVFAFARWPRLANPSYAGQGQPYPYGGQPYGGQYGGQQPAFGGQYPQQGPNPGQPSPQYPPYPTNQR